MSMKKFIFLFASVITLLTGVSCSSDDDNDNSAIESYVGTWVCSSPDSYYPSTIVTTGTTLQIISSGSMTWTTPQGINYSATMKALGDDWANITYNNKTYKDVEIYVSNNTLYINANGAESLKTKDFPFDGDYIKSN